MLVFNSQLNGKPWEVYWMYILKGSLLLLHVRANVEGRREKGDQGGGYHTRPSERWWGARIAGVGGRTVKSMKNGGIWVTF